MPRKCHVYHVSTGDWRVRVKFRGKWVDHGGSFQTKEQAEAHCRAISSRVVSGTRRTKMRRHGVRKRSGSKLRHRLLARMNKTRARLRRKRRASRNTLRDTPLAREYRQAKAAYHKVGRALRTSCSARSRECGFPARAKMPGRKRFKFRSASVNAMMSDFLGAPSDTGTNEDAIRHAIGNMSVRDRTQWEPVSEKYEKKGVETFDQAFRVLARESKRDWRKFDIQALRECPGMASVELPAFMHEAKSQEETEEHLNVPF